MTTAPPLPLAAALRDHGFTGQIVEPGDAGYDAARAGWNGAIDRRPAAIARASDAEDVAAAIRGARAAGLAFTVRAFATGGVYVNALHSDRPARDAYADEVWERLAAVKRRYDPDGVFAGNGIG